MSQRSMNMEVKISVICPIYNMGIYLSECLDSIVNQTIEDLEIIAVNDGSTDDCSSILKKYQERYKNIVILNQSNHGTGTAKNNGIRHARGKYLIFIDPDDYYPNNSCLEELYRAAEMNHVSMCGGVITWNYGGTKTKADYPGGRQILSDVLIKTVDYGEIYGHQRYLFKADLIKKNNILFPAYRRYEDPPFTLKAQVCSEEIMLINKEVYVHRVGYKRLDYSLSTSMDILHGIRDVYRIAEENNLLKVYESVLKNIVADYILPFYKYSFDGYEEIDNVIKEINQIVERWTGDKENIITEEIVNKYREKSIRQYKDIVETLDSNRPIILYGAGLNTQFFLDLFKNNMANILGIAVTKKNSAQKFKYTSLKIQQIEEYQEYANEAIVLITAGANYWREIEENLRKLRFGNVKPVNVRNLEIAFMLLKNGTR